MGIEREELQGIYDNLSKEILNLNNLKSRIKSILDGVAVEESVDIPTVRYYGILDDIDKMGGIVTSKELSDISKKWGRDPRGTAGFFTGKNPLLAGIANDKRALTETGINGLNDFRNKHGEDWQSHIDIEVVKYANHPESHILFINLPIKK